jgi:hypothetical protein
VSVIRFTGFVGANRAVHPMLLGDSVGVTSLNQKPGRSDLRPWNAPLNKATVPASRKTIHRMGRDVASDTQYWLSWPTTVHAVLGGNAADTSERTYYTGDGAPKWTDTTKALAAAPYPTASRTLGIPAPSGAISLSAAGGTSATVETRFYLDTFVSDIGEESAPNPAPVSITCKQDDTVTISTLPAAPGGSYGITLRRIYRTQDGLTTAGAFYFLREIASGLTSTTDDNRTLGETLATTSWLTPPTDLKCLTGLWNGMMAGISGRSLRFCEAYTYYAWPIEYEIIPANTMPVALATFGQTLVMLTDGNPSVVVGGSPDAMDESPVAFDQSCVSVLSAVGMGHGVAWASPDGLAYIGSSGPRLLTDGLMTRDDWQALVPSTIEAAMYERRYIATYNDGTGRKGFVIDPANPDGIYFLDFGFDAMHVDALQDALFVLDGVNVQKWDAGTALTTTFKSKLFHQSKPTPSFACAQVTGGHSVGTPAMFKLYVDGALIHTESVTSSEPFRLPAGYLGVDFQIEVTTTTNIQAVAMAHSMRELAQT